MTHFTRRLRPDLKVFGRALARLREALESDSLSALETDGVVRRFRQTAGLAWRALGDHLPDGRMLPPDTAPRTIVRRAFETGMIPDPDAWHRLLDARDLVRRIQDVDSLQQVVADVRTCYLAVLDELHESLLIQTAPDTTPGRPINAQPTRWSRS